jgi:hypothetical protein
MRRAFVIRPFGTKQVSAGTEIDFERVHRELIEPALKQAGLDGGTTGEILEAGNIREDTFALIIEADLVVCDVTLHNANVFYELGIRHALRKKHTVVIRGKPTADDTPFDILTDRYLRYEHINPAMALSALTGAIQATLASEYETDSPVFKMLRDLREVDAAVVQAVPTDFSEDVARARAAKSAGWLRLLAGEVEGLRFQWPALRLVGQALWDLNDYRGACKTWECLRAADPDDLPANLALSSIFERLYRLEKRSEFLEQSNLALARALRSSKITDRQRAEANALKARNLKTLWRLDFEGETGLAKRRQRAAASRTLLKAYEAYRNAYFEDLNHYWSELAALQLATVALDLSREDTWQDAFDNSDEGTVYAGKLKQQIGTLQILVSQAIEVTLRRLAPGDKDRIWAEISAADLKFLIEARPNRIIEAYKEAIPTNGYFAWDAARGQLQLFAQLGIKADLANEVIRAVEERMAHPEQDETPFHQIVFAGHRVDEVGRNEPRFPSEREGRARDLIRAKLAGMCEAGTRIGVLASAAPGSDILCHELCRELSINSTICLPMPKEDFAARVFSDLDSWRSRYLALVASRQVLQLSDQVGLPRWFKCLDVNAWERGNRWVLEMARASGAAKITLIALWDGRTSGDGPGGTAHMVRLARDAGNIGVDLINTRDLLT